MSENRVTLGIGAGWSKDEFALVGQSFERRGRRMDESIEVLRKLWTGEMVEHHGELYSFDRLQMGPGVTEPIPIWSGGTSEAALRRVGNLTDGWLSEVHGEDELRELVGRIRKHRAEAGRADAPLSIVGACKDVFDLDGFRRLEDAGITHLLTVPWASRGLDGHTLEAKCEGLRRFADDVIAHM